MRATRSLPSFAHGQTPSLQTGTGAGTGTGVGVGQVVTLNVTAIGCDETPSAFIGGRINPGSSVTSTRIAAMEILQTPSLSLIHI